MTGLNLGMKLSAVRTLIAITLGIALAELTSPPWWLALLTITIGAVFIYWSRGLSSYLIITAAALLYARSFQPGPVPEKIYRLQKFSGTVVEEPHRLPIMTVKLLSPLSGKVLIRLRDATADFRFGDVVEIKSRIQQFSFPTNPGIPDRNRQLYKQGFIGHTAVNTVNIRIIRRNCGNPVITRVIMPLRRYLLNTINQYLLAKDAGLLLGILLGEKGTLPRETEAALTTTGLWHLLAVSGLHMGIIVSAVYLLLTVLNIRSWARFILLTLATFIYAAVAGWHPAATRAAIMAWSLFLSFPLQRRAAPLTTLAVAGIILLLLNPAALNHIGTQLSFAATAAIILFIPNFQTWLKKMPLRRPLRSYLLLPLGVSLAATIGTAPLLAHHFYQLQPFSFLATLVIYPLITLLIPLGLLVALANALSPAIATLLASPLQLLTHLTRLLINSLGNLLQPLLLITGRPPWLAVFYFYGLLLLLINWHRNYARTAFRISLLAGIVLVVGLKALNQPETKITFLDPGQGDAALLEDRLGRKLLIDAGIDRTGILNQYLLSRRILHLDAAIITHPDRDHYGGLFDLNRNIRIDRLIIPTRSGDSDYQQLLRHLESLGTLIDSVTSGARLTGFGFDIEFCAPDPLTRRLYYRRLVPVNQVSIVNLVRYDTLTLLFTGDCESYSTLSRIAAGRKIHFLKAPHHGSRKGNPAALYDTIRPEWVIVMGRYPTPAGLETILPARSIRYLNTRQDGGRILKLENGAPGFFEN
ncbi:MAG: DNA internalization-related competence protein ComEC/Rec2 [candidate division WOR-3 bacterium]